MAMTKEEKNAKRRATRHKYREQETAYMRDYRKKNAEKQKEYVHDYYEKNKDKIAEYQRKYREAHPEYRADNRERLNKYTVNYLNNKRADENALINAVLELREELGVPEPVYEYEPLPPRDSSDPESLKAYNRAIYKKRRQKVRYFQDEFEELVKLKGEMKSSTENADENNETND